MPRHYKRLYWVVTVEAYNYDDDSKWPVGTYGPFTSFEKASWFADKAQGLSDAVSASVEYLVPSRGVWEELQQALIEQGIEMEKS